VQGGAIVKANFCAGITAICGCLLLMTVLMSCDSRQTYIGTYLAADAGGGPCEPTVVDLRENGEGTWTCNHEEVTFTWHVKDGEIRIHTREGGIMTGTLTKNGFLLRMPLETELRFEKISPAKN
jgi:hypothetical protein